jgi:plasmid stability protein
VATKWQSLSVDQADANDAYRGGSPQASVAYTRGGAEMPAILVRSLDAKTLRRLKERARLNGHSLEQEVKAILERAVRTPTMDEAGQLSDRWRRRLGIRSPRTPSFATNHGSPSRQSPRRRRAQGRTRGAVHGDRRYNRKR